MKTFGLALMIVGLSMLWFTIFGGTITTEDNIRNIAERCYFEGQKDALNKDVRIKINKDSTYIWVKSPWDSGRKPTFIPDNIDSNSNVEINK